jgi:glycosyltransferase involved in cell wall biosynthesis
VSVDWFEFDDRVEVRNSVTKPRPMLRIGDVVVTTAVQTIPWGARVAHACGVRCVALIQHFEEWAAAPDDIFGAWAAADARVVIAPWLAERCASVGLDSVLIPNAIDSDRFPPGPPVAQRAPGVLSLLAPHAYKRPDVVIAALTEAARLVPGLRLTAFGQARRPAELPENVDYVQDPSHDQLVHLYQSHPVYLCGSDAEGWHLPPAEASLCGAAVVSTDIGGVRVSMADDAWYAPAGDWRGLAEQVAAVLGDSAEASERVARTQARLRARTYQANAAELAAVLFPPS